VGAHLLDVTYERAGRPHMLQARRVIVTTGGRSLPRTGSDGSGYALVRALGHTVTDTHPALVPLVLRRGFFHTDLRGISHDAELTTLANARRIDRRSGSLLWTHFGVSGPVVLDASRHWVLAHARGDATQLRLSVLPGKTPDDADALLQSLARERPRASLGRVLAGLLPERLADALLHAADVDPATPAAQLARDPRRRLARCLTELVLPVERDRGWDFAEVTAGGVPLAEVDYRTMASRKSDGLLLAGEILDCDGRIGGFNFQWAWATGFLAGRAAVRSLRGMQSSSSLTPR
jgi:predicted Rossmann fold flavoprotein